MASNTLSQGQVKGSPLVSILFLALLLFQPAAAASYPVTIPYGRSWPISIVVDAKRGFAYVDGMSGIYPPTGFSFGIINVTSHEVVRVLPLDEIPGAMALDEASGDVYIAGNASIQVFDEGNQSMGRTIAVGHPIRSIEYDGSVSRSIFVTAGNRVYALDPQSGSIIGSAAVGNGANGMALDSTGKLFVAEYPDSEILVFQAQNLSMIHTVSLPTCCAAQMAIDPKTHLLFATTGTRYVEVVDAQDYSLVNSLAVGSTDLNSTNVVAVDNQTGRVYVSSSPGGSIAELDGSGKASVSRFEAEGQVAGMAVDSITHELFATNYHQVTVFDISRARILLVGIVLGAVAAAIIAVAAVLILRARRRRGPQG